jgi:hypothetical protein
MQPCAVAIANPASYEPAKSLTLRATRLHTDTERERHFTRPRTNMTEQHEHPSEDQQLEKLREQWEKEWGPKISPWKRRMAALFILGALVALVVAAVVSVP